MVAEVQAVDQHDPDVERVERLREPRGQARLGERHEAARHAALGDRALRASRRAADRARG